MTHPQPNPSALAHPTPQPPAVTLALRYCDTCRCFLGSLWWPWSGLHVEITHGMCDGCFKKKYGHLEDAA